MSSGLSPLRAFRTSRSVLSVRALSTKPVLKTSTTSSSSSTLLRDFAASSNTASAARSGAGSRYSEMADRLVRQTDKRSSWRRNSIAEDMRIGEENTRLRDMLKTSRRTWQAGDVYAPHDLTSGEAKKWRKKQSPSSDVFDQLAINPLDEWKNVAMMGEFQTTMGRIKQRKDTGLRPVNQRKIAKAIRRSIGLGFLPSVHAHPELLRRGAQAGFYL